MLPEVCEFVLVLGELMLPLDPMLPELLGLLWAAEEPLPLCVSLVEGVCAQTLIAKASTRETKSDNFFINYLAPLQNDGISFGIC